MATRWPSRGIGQGKGLQLAILAREWWARRLSDNEFLAEAHGLGFSPPQAVALMECFGRLRDDTEREGRPGEGSPGSG